ncbi:hypothetical protein PLUTE_a4879 [Pseudoalteromonas luteoviolacea DSM 6061]|nr:hypothetical protein [Pseudoalteromonas luteoviolacea DSM 6061]
MLQLKLPNLLIKSQHLLTLKFFVIKLVASGFDVLIMLFFCIVFCS